MLKIFKLVASDNEKEKCEGEVVEGASVRWKIKGAHTIPEDIFARFIHPEQIDFHKFHSALLCSIFINDISSSSYSCECIMEFVFILKMKFLREQIFFPSPMLP